ncbi:MAG: DUF4369 domain-containing protein, partial [Pedobacter sp.]|nr:DUF4369 domain-containing protein [Pedobacter sp.]
MKKFILAALCSLPCVVMAQQSFTLNGEVKNLKAGDKIYLVYVDGGKRVIDSTQVANGAFTFKGNINEPSMANVFKNINPFSPGADTRFLDYTSLYLEPGTILASTVDSLKSAKISGTVTNDAQAKLTAALKPYTDKMMVLNEEFTKLSPEQKKDEKSVGPIRDRAMTIGEEMIPIYIDFIKNNPTSFVSLNTLMQFVDDPSMATQVISLFEGLSSELKATKLGAMLATKFEGEKKTAIGAMALDFTQNDQNGKPIKLSDFKGKYV